MIVVNREDEIVVNREDEMVVTTTDETPGCSQGVER